MAAITVSDLENSLGEVDLDSIKNESIELETGETYLAGLLTKLLEKYPLLSVSFLNTQFSGKGRKFFLNFDFLRKVSNSFAVTVIGSDLKISLRKSSSCASRFGKFDEHDAFFCQLSQILEKDNGTCRMLTRKLADNKGTGSLSQLQDEWSSNKFKLNLPFIVRNSHQFILFMTSNKSFVSNSQLQLNQNQIEIDEKTIWKIVDNRVEDMVVRCLQSLLSKVDYPVNQGTLQSCVNYGFPAIDRGFMRINVEVFIGGGDKGIALKNSKAAKLIGLNMKTNSTAEYKPSPTSPQSTSEGQKGAVSGNIMSEIQKAHLNRQTVVLLGEQNSFPPIFLAESNFSNAAQVESLLSLKEYIESEISKKKSSSR